MVNLNIATDESYIDKNSGEEPDELVKSARQLQESLLDQDPD